MRYIAGMDSSQDTEITLGTAKLLGLFFGLVIICAVFFALGYTLGRKSDIGLAAAGSGAQLTTTSSGPKPAGSPSAQPMTFYKAVEQKDANAQLTPSSSGAASTTPVTADQRAAASSPGTQAQPSANPPDPMTGIIPTAGYFVQVAAVTKQGDAEALVDALKKKQYPAFVASNNATDKLFRVQVGPFAEIKDAETMRSRLINDGYNPILKK
jgi:DedD protein